MDEMNRDPLLRFTGRLRIFDPSPGVRGSRTWVDTAALVAVSVIKLVRKER
jgi:hypothetical protein